MVLNKDYISDNEEEDPWELIDGGGGEDENISSEESQQTEQINIATDNDDVISGDNERESLLLQEEEATNQNDDDDDDNVSVTTGVSSITGDNTTISDVDEDGEGVNNIIEGTRLHEQADQFTTSNTSAGSSSSENNTITDNKSTKKSYTSADDPLVEQLSQMGFEKEHIQKAIDDLREAGSTEIDADSIIGSMVGETVIGRNNNNDDDDNNEQHQQHPTNPFALPLHSTWEFVESTVQEIDNRHQLRHRTQRCVQTINRSAQELWSNVKDESQKFRSNVRQTCDQADVQARNATVHVRTAASSAKDSLVRANEEYGVMEKVAAVAIVGGATLLALGSPRAGVASMAIAGASIAAGEAMKSQQQQTRDYGLREGVHLD